MKNYINNNEKVVLISGASSGIGLETAKLFQASSYKVYDLSRRGSSNDGITHIHCDVSSDECVKTAVSKILSEENKIDILISNAGFGIAGPVEYTPMSLIKKQFEVNFFGAVRLVQAVLPAMKKQKSGRIVFTSSVAAEIPIPFQAFYSASKAALNRFSEALSNELRPFCISCTALMPGDSPSGFVRENAKNFGEYEKICRKSIEKMEADERNGSSPAKIAEDIFKTAISGADPKPLKVSGFSYKIAAAAYRMLPARLTNYILRKMYAE